MSVKCPTIIAGPCAVESMEQMRTIVPFLLSMKIQYIRAGAFKPRTSPDDFQGLGMEGLSILEAVRREYSVKIVSEIVDIRHLERMCQCVDILQVGARNMDNYELLKERGRSRVHVLLKRHMSATIAEFEKAAQYILREGNPNLILCERGIRTFENATRNTLDLSCCALMKRRLDLPIIVDISHSLGRKDIAAPMAKAALAAGADGLMIEVHQQPSIALSDAAQQMDFIEFEDFLQNIRAAGAMGEL